MSYNFTRKDFIKNSAFGLSGMLLGGMATSASGKSTLLERKPWKDKFSANDRLNIATIGMGIIAQYDTATALELPGVNLVAVSDLYNSRLERAKAKYGPDLFITKDYRDILEMDEVDAVLICTPDHWHAKISIDAMNAGKHVYCEKPMIHKLDEGKKIIETQKKTGMVMEIGSQFASDIVFNKAAELYKTGAIGKLNQVSIAYNRNSALGAWQYSMPEDANANNIDWDTWLGDAPKVPFDPKRFFRWRAYKDYGTGVPGDLFVHLFTGVHTVLDSMGPQYIFGSGGIRSWEDGRELPDVIFGQYEYPETDTHPDFTLLLQGNLADGSDSQSMFRFIGEEGFIDLAPGNNVKLTRLPRRSASLDQLMNGYNSIISFSEDVQKEFEKNYKKAHADIMPTPPRLDQTEEFHTPGGYDNRLDHFVNFFDAIRNGGSVLEDPEFGLRAAAPSVLTNKSNNEKTVVEWDPVNMKVV